MKSIFFLSIPFFLFLSCHNTRAMSVSPLQQYGRSEQINDSFLHSLQQNNELVLAFAVETYAWARTVNYKIIAMTNHQWKAYSYFVNNTVRASATAKINPVVVSNDLCNTIWKFFQEKELWKIKGDNGKYFCSGDKKNDCNINDGAMWRLFIITKDKVIDPSYYEPEYFENCCPGITDRHLFVEAANKIRNIVSVEEEIR